MRNDYEDRSVLTHGLKSRKLANKKLRAKGMVPQPGRGAGVKRVARYLKQVPAIIQETA